MASWCFRRAKYVVVAVAASIALAFSSNAAVETFSVSISPAVANYSNREIEVPQFNSALGELESITIDLQGAGAFVQGFNHPAGGNRQLSDSQNLDLLLQQSDHQGLISLSESENRFFASLGHNAVDSLRGRLNRVFLRGQTILNSPEDLMQFTGSGFVDLFLSAKSGLDDPMAGRSTLLRGFWTVGGDIKVTYNYVVPAVTAVPEISTALAGGFAASVALYMVLSTRLRSSKNSQNMGAICR